LPADGSSGSLHLYPCARPTNLVTDPLLFNDRELSFLRFQERIFQEASDDTTPLLDRVKFLAIVGTHLDDFLMARAPELKRNVARRMVAESVVKQLLHDVEVCWRRQLVRALRAAGIHITDYKRLTADERADVSRYFGETVYSSLSPQRWDPSSFPRVAILGMNFVVSTLNAADEEVLFVVRVPDGLSPLVPFQIRRDLGASAPTHGGRAVQGFVWLDQVVRANLTAVFSEMRIVAAYPFRLLREMGVPPHSLTSAGAVDRVMEVLARRESNPVVALVVDRRMPPRIAEMLARGLGAPDNAVHRSGVVSDLRRLWEVSRIARADLKPAQFVPRMSASLRGASDVLAAARERDILFHHPYESFQPVIDMFRQAVDDPDVASVSATLYRTDRESPVAHALVDAARRGKRVRVVVELNARLDEHRNLKWSRALEQAGGAVFHAPPGLKVHAKLALIVRREGDRLRQYAHISSGNYNAFTGKTYTDFGLLTCDDDISADVAGLFDALCGGTGPAQYRALTIAPLTMRDTLTALVEREIACRRRGEAAHMILKMNALVDREVIALLYRASQQGVNVDLLVRGICCLRPGVPGVSERIRVRSIVGRFLEHSRAWYFRNGGREDVYIGSADLMPRNFDRRVEVMAPVKDARLRREVFEILSAYLADTVKARELCANGRYVRHRARPDEQDLNSQLALLQGAGDAPEADLNVPSGLAMSSA
jgi:polyphosphate kinase